MLIASLPQRGYTAHVLGYTLDKILSAIDPTQHPGVFNEVVLPVIGYIEEESFGSTGEAKDATEYGGGIREVKKRPAPVIFKQLASGISRDKFDLLM